jgi:DNA-binding FrmR family transcriptional regulator
MGTDAGPAPLPPLVTRTDDRGRYAFTDLPPMTVQLRARAPLGSGLADVAWPNAPTLAAAGTLQVAAAPVRADLDLPRGGSVTGRVIDATTGSAVPGAVVVATAPTVGGTAEEVGQPLPVDEPGAFRIAALPPIPLQLAVRLPSGTSHLGPWFWGGEDPRREALQLDGATTTEAVTVRLDRGATLRGTVRDGAGAPVPRALVGVEGCAVSCPLAVPTDAAGRYTIAGIPPGSGLTLSTWLGTGDEYRLWYGGASTRAQAEQLSLAPGERREGVDLTLPLGAEVRLRVLGVAGTPLPTVAVQLVPAPGPDGGGYGPRRNIAEPDPQDATRRLVGPVPPGRYTVVILTTGGSRVCRTDGWQAGAGVAEDGTITLAAGDLVEAEVQLACEVRWPEAAPPDRPGPDAQGDDRADDRAAPTPAWPWRDPTPTFVDLPAWAQQSRACAGESDPPLVAGTPWGYAGTMTDTSPGYSEDKAAVLLRLRRIEGQVRGLQRMVESDQYCIDVLTQVSATTRALESVALRLLDDHLSHCVAHAVAEGGEVGDAKLAEASAAIARLVRS